MRIESKFSDSPHSLPIPVRSLREGQIRLLGDLKGPVSNLRFEGLTFANATWLGPSSSNEYVSDQSGFHLVGQDHTPNTIGHERNEVRTPGNVRLRFAQGITFRGNIFEHLGGTGLDFDTGSQDNPTDGNRSIEKMLLAVGTVSSGDKPKHSTDCSGSGSNPSNSGTYLSRDLEVDRRIEVRSSILVPWRGNSRAGCCTFETALIYCIVERQLIESRQRETRLL